MMHGDNTQASSNKSGIDGLHVALIIVLVIIVTVLATYWLLTSYLFPSAFDPVTLNTQEQQVLEQKLENFDFTSSGRLRPEKYSEQGTKRKLAFSEKELNALLASNTDLARELAIDLSDNLISAKLLIPLDEDFPVLGGKTLKVKAGLEFAYKNARPVVVLKGVNLMGVPVPNAWLGELKNIDLVAQYGDQQGFWQAFADGVDNISVSDGQLNIELKE